jgi:hypothetical protein
VCGSITHRRRRTREPRLTTAACSNLFWLRIPAVRVRSFTRVTAVAILMALAFVASWTVHYMTIFGERAPSIGDEWGNHSGSCGSHKARQALHRSSVIDRSGGNGMAKVGHKPGGPRQLHHCLGHTHAGPASRLPAMLPQVQARFIARSSGDQPCLLQQSGNLCVPRYGSGSHGILRRTGWSISHWFCEAGTMNVHYEVKVDIISRFSLNEVCVHSITATASVERTSRLL